VSFYSFLSVLQLFLYHVCLTPGGLGVTYDAFLLNLNVLLTKKNKFAFLGFPRPPRACCPNARRSEADNKFNKTSILMRNRYFLPKTVVFCENRPPCQNSLPRKEVARIGFRARPGGLSGGPSQRLSTWATIWTCCIAPNGFPTTFEQMMRNRFQTAYDAAMLGWPLRLLRT
jgi:hypothetical protein